MDVGLLNFESTTYTVDESQKFISEIKARAIQQCLSWYEKVRDLPPTFHQLSWGDETVYSVVVSDAKKKQVKVSLSIPEVLERIRKTEESEPKISEVDGVTWLPEYTKYMIEGIPSKPYEATVAGLLTVEPSMKSRRETIRKYFRRNERLITLSSFFRLGVEEFSSPYYPPEGDSMSDSVITPIARYQQIITNVRSRRGHKYRFDVPIYNGTNSSQTKKHVTLDHCGYGIGCCCLQVTFQAADLNQALYLHDQTAVIAPLMLALSAATPIFKGYLCERDCRWDIVSCSSDDRTDEEREYKRARFASIPRYYSNRPEWKPEYNDTDVSYDEDAYKTLSEHGMEESLARFFANAFSFHPLFIPKGEIASCTKKDGDAEFEYLLGVTYPSIRLKIAPVDQTMGWRIEFRTIEIQPNDFENAAFAVVMNLLVRTILHFQLDLLIPISKNDDNMERAQLRDAARQQKFWFRKNILHHSKQHRSRKKNADIENEYTLLSLDQIFNGVAGVHTGLIPLIHQYLDEQNLSFDIRQKLNEYIRLVQNKANGTKLTTAQSIREFVLAHRNYKNDSYVDDLINFDLIENFY